MNDFTKKIKRSFFSFKKKLTNLGSSNERDGGEGEEGRGGGEERKGKKEKRNRINI